MCKRFAPEKAASFRPAVVIPDMGLAGMGGFAVAQHMRQLPADIAFLSGILSGADRFTGGFPGRAVPAVVLSPRTCPTALS